MKVRGNLGKGSVTAESREHLRRLEGKVRLNHAGSHGPLYGALSHSKSNGVGERGDHVCFTKRSCWRKGKEWVEEGAVNEGRPVRRLYSKWGRRGLGQGRWWQCREVSRSERCCGAKPDSTCCWVGHGG